MCVCNVRDELGDWALCANKELNLSRRLLVHIELEHLSQTKAALVSMS